MEKKIKIILNLYELQAIIDIMSNNKSRKPDLSNTAEFSAKFDTDMNAYVIDTNATACQFCGFAECNALSFRLPSDKK